LLLDRIRKEMQKCTSMYVHITVCVCVCKLVLCLIASLCQLSSVQYFYPRASVVHTRCILLRHTHTHIQTHTNRISSPCAAFPDASASFLVHLNLLIPRSLTDWVILTVLYANFKHIITCTHTPCSVCGSLRASPHRAHKLRSACAAFPAVSAVPRPRKRTTRMACREGGGAACHARK